MMTLISEAMRSLAPDHLAQKARHRTKVLHLKTKALSTISMYFADGHHPDHLLFIKSTFSLALSSSVHPETKV